MNAIRRSWPDESVQTRPVDVLALTGERRATGTDEAFPLDQFLDDAWDDETAQAPTAIRRASGDLHGTHEALTVQQHDALDVILLEDADAWDIVAEEDDEVTGRIEAVRPRADAIEVEEDEEAWEDAIPDDEDDGAAFTFFVAGPAPAVVRIQRGERALTQAIGIVKRIEEDRFVLGTPGSTRNEIAVGFRLPASVDLRGLIGRRVRVTLDEQLVGDRTTGRTLSVHTTDDRAWLVAFCGTPSEATYNMGGMNARVSLSMREGSPLVVAVAEVRHIVPLGTETRVPIALRRFAMEALPRDPAGRIAYVLTDDALWH